MKKIIILILVSISLFAVGVVIDDRMLDIDFNNIPTWKSVFHRVMYVVVGVILCKMVPENKKRTQ